MTHQRALVPAFLRIKQLVTGFSKPRSIKLPNGIFGNARRGWVSEGILNRLGSPQQCVGGRYLHKWHPVHQ